jgi:hypothetical protein
VNDFERQPLDTYGRLAMGEPACVDRLRRPTRLALPTPYEFPGRNPLVAYLSSDGERVRISEGGDLLRYLESQGMDLGLDAVLSKTVFHAVKETPGARMAAGQICMDSTPERVAADLPRFVQTVIEIVGLRHAKYKEALVRLARAGECVSPGVQPLAAPF